MRARTIDELSTFLRDDLAWRRKENRVLQTLVKNSKEPQKQAVLRGAVASVYAHWEGFVKTACRVYLEFVRGRRLRNCDLSVPLLGLALRLALRSSHATSRIDSHLEFGDWLLREWERRARLPDPEELINTSNLSVYVFKSYIIGLGLEYLSEYERAEKPVIEVLLKSRNNLAHGEWQIVNEAEYEQWVSWTDRLMVLLCEQVEDAAAKSAYRRRLTQLL
jgi:hypothetical protein